MKSYHLTLMTIPISLAIVGLSFFAKQDIAWLWGISTLIALQWLTDSLDGAIGRANGEGLIRWGYYMDHFLDYIFLCSILIGYSILLPDHFKYLHFFVLALFGGFMVNTYLAFAASNRFRISHLGVGPTEIRAIFILINTLLIFFGQTYLAQTLPYVLPLTVIGLIIVIYRTQRELWKTDMDAKRSQEHRNQTIQQSNNPHYFPEESATKDPL
jgi:phosphatidylglycerophosphate synthase